MAKRSNPMPLAASQEGTAYALVRADPAAEAGRVVVSQGRRNARRGGLSLNGQRETYPGGTDNNMNGAGKLGCAPVAASPPVAELKHDQLPAGGSLREQARSVARNGHVQHVQEPDGQVSEAWSRNGQRQHDPEPTGLRHNGVEQTGVAEDVRNDVSVTRNGQARNAQTRSGERKNNPAPGNRGPNGCTQDGQVQNGLALNPWSQNQEFQNSNAWGDGSRGGLTQTDQTSNGQLRAQSIDADSMQNIPIKKLHLTDDVVTLIRNHRLDEASRVVTALLEQRIADGDSELHAARMLLQHYHIVLSRQPPLSHIGAVPLRPNDRLYACFDQFIDLIRQQQSQVAELQAIIAELI